MRTPIIIDSGGSIRIHSAEKLRPRGSKEGRYLWDMASAGAGHSVLAVEVGEGCRVRLQPDKRPGGRPRTLSIWTGENMSGPAAIVVQEQHGFKARLELSFLDVNLGEPRGGTYPGYPDIQWVYHWPSEHAPDRPRGYRLEDPRGTIRQRAVENAVFEFTDLGWHDDWGWRKRRLRRRYPWWIVGLSAGAILAALLIRKDFEAESGGEGEWAEPW
jgi:hypothetical protein